MRNLFLILLTITTILCSCNKDVMETGIADEMQHEVNSNQESDLSLRNTNDYGQFSLTAFPIINPGTQQNFTRSFSGSARCYDGVVGIDNVKFSIDIEVKLSSYKNNTDGVTNVYVDEITVKNAKIDIGASSIAPEILSLNLYDYLTEPEYVLKDHQGVFLERIDEIGPLTYDVNKTFKVTGTKPLMISLNIGQFTISPFEVCPLNPTFVIATNEGLSSMNEMRTTLRHVLPNKNDRIAAAWTLDDHLGLIYGNEYAIVNMRHPDIVARGKLRDAGAFWKDAPWVYDTDGWHHPISEDKGITAGWIFKDLIGFTSKNTYWNSYISDFHKPDVWGFPTSGSGKLRDVPFWNDQGAGLPPARGITAGFMTPFNSFVAFSGNKIFVRSTISNKWIISKPISELQPGEPFYFLKNAPSTPEHQLTEINAAFYNAGSKEFVFMNKQSWWAYKYNGEQPGIWTFGGLHD